MQNAVAERTKTISVEPFFVVCFLTFYLVCLAIGCPGLAIGAFLCCRGFEGDTVLPQCLLARPHRGWDFCVDRRPLRQTGMSAQDCGLRYCHCWMVDGAVPTSPTDYYMPKKVHKNKSEVRSFAACLPDALILLRRTLHLW